MPEYLFSVLSKVVKTAKVHREVHRKTKIQIKSSKPQKAKSPVNYSFTRL